MSSDSQNEKDRRSTADRRTVTDRRNEDERRADTDRRNLLAGLGGKQVAPPHPRELLRTDPMGTPGMPRSAPSSSLHYIHPKGQYPMGDRVPLSPAVKSGNLVYVSGIPGYDERGQLAVGDFAAQMRQVMDNITGILHAAGTGWSHVMKVNVLLTRREDVAEMNRLYAEYFPSGKYPARTTAIVYSLPHQDFLLEIECVAVVS
jgi:reactive intermediate/imine deaminase